MYGKSLALLTSLVFAGHAFAAEGDWLVRGRLIQIAPDVSTSGALRGLDVDVDDQVVPELDFTYMVTERLGVELILGTARHKVKAGSTALGKVSHLPPTLTLQYHFAPNATFRPYVGVGVNYTRFYDEDMPGLKVDRSSVGGSLQIGADYAINDRWFVNVDLKKLYIETDVSTDAGADLGTLSIDPLVFGVGFGTRF